MNNHKQLYNLAGWLVFLIATVVYYFSVESTGSLWDCGEFITGAYKLQVVHPPGAPLFMIIGRMFAWVASLVSSNPTTVAVAVNMLSGICTAFAATFVCWTTILFGRMTLADRTEEVDNAQAWSLAGAGVVAGLATAFCTSIWFSAVEGEVYAMSTMFTTMTLWAMVKWYVLPDSPKADRWILFALYAAGLSIGVHLLSLLTFPALALLYYFKKYQNHTILGGIMAASVGTLVIGLIQKLIITGIPNLWASLDLFAVNTLGLPFHSGLIFLNIILAGILIFGLRYAHNHNHGVLQKALIGLFLVGVGFSTIGVIVIRANANTPINMNNPSDAMRLIPYLNREQYGERALLKGPLFDSSPIGLKEEDRYGRVGERYEVVDRKVEYEYNPNDEVLFPRMAHTEQGRPELYRLWMNGKQGKPSFGDNIVFFWQYQIKWMYWRYFMWNFSGRQNGDQGYFSWDPSSGNWLTGIDAIDSNRLYNQDQMPKTMKNNQARNKYYMIPFILGLIGLYYQYHKCRKDLLALFILFLITGIGIIVYSNEPPNEPRERDYVLVGSFFTYCIWIGMSVLALFEIFRDKVKLPSMASAGVASALALTAPILMGTQNFDDNSRRGHTAARDYAANFLESCDKNAIIFTYGDNDTYPLWYAQEVEGIRKDVRVVNLSLIAVDWYIEQLRRKLNDSPAIKMSIPSTAYRGFKRNQIPINPNGPDLPLKDAVRYIGEDHPVPLSSGQSLESSVPSAHLYIDVDPAKAIANGFATQQDSIVSRINLTLEGRSYLIKDDIAILDIIANNAFERPVYFAVTCRPEKLFGMDDFFQLEGLGIKLVPVKSNGDAMLGMVGKGKVSNKAYDNIMSKFKWGNFDKHPTFVDKSYMPSVQSLKATMWRVARNELQFGDKEKGLKMLDKIFVAFPHFNFPYDARTYPIISTYGVAGEFARGKKHYKILADEMLEYLKFYASLDPSDVEAGFREDQQAAKAAMMQIINDAEKAGDTTFANDLKSKFAPYNTPNK